MSLKTLKLSFACVFLLVGLAGMALGCGDDSNGGGSQDAGQQQDGSLAGSGAGANAGSGGTSGNDQDSGVDESTAGTGSAGTGSAGTGTAGTGSAGTGSAGTGSAGTGSAGTGGTDVDEWFCVETSNGECTCVPSPGLAQDTCTDKPTCCFLVESAEGVTGCQCWLEGSAACGLKGMDGFPAVATCPPT